MPRCCPIKGTAHPRCHPASTRRFQHSDNLGERSALTFLHAGIKEVWNHTWSGLSIGNLATSPNFSGSEKP